MEPFVDFEKDDRFCDLVKYHLPRGSCVTQIWNEYKRNLAKYSNLKYNLYEDIKLDIQNKTTLKFNPDWNGNQFFNRHLVDIIYAQYVYFITDRKFSTEEFREIKTQGCELWIGGTGVARGNADELGQLETLLKDTLWKENKLMTYETKVRETIDAREQTVRLEADVKREIKLSWCEFPFISGIRCPALWSLFKNHLI